MMKKSDEAKSCRAAKAINNYQGDLPGDFSNTQSLRDTLKLLEQDNRALARELIESRKTQGKLTLENNALNDSIDELEGFARSLSHDLREPLRTITIHLKKCLSGSSTPEHHESELNKALLVADGMRLMIEGLLEYACKTEEGSTLEKVDCGQIVQSCIANLHGAIKKSGATVSCTDLPVIEAHRVQIERLFQNIISNSLKYRGKNAPVVSIKAEKRSSFWLFSIEDNGVGVEKGQEKSVFQSFKQLNPSAENKGRGLGLSFCRVIVRRHHGELWLESNKYSGTTVYFTLQENASRQ